MRYTANRMPEMLLLGIWGLGEILSLFYLFLASRHTTKKDAL